MSYVFQLCYAAPSLTLELQTVAGHLVAWVNNQFQQYVYDITDYLASPLANDTSLNISFESPITYGQNISSRADVETEIAPAVSTHLQPYSVGLTAIGVV